VALDDATTFDVAGRAFIENELLSWDGVTITSSPAGQLQNVVRGIGDTTADSHAIATSLYNSWIDERIEQLSSHVNDQLPNYDIFPDARSLNDPTPFTINMITRDLVVADGFRKIGIDRSADNIQENFRKQAIEKLKGLAVDSIVIEPRFFVDSLVFGSEDVLLNTEAPLAKPNLDPYSASITDLQVKYVIFTPDEAVNPNLPRRFRSSEFTTSIGGFIYWSELQNRWIFRAVASSIPDGTNIHYEFTEHRMNWALKRKAEQRGWLDVIRG